MTILDGQFDDGPVMQPLGDIFASTKTGGRKPVDSLPSWARGQCDSRPCATKAELADWFQEFALACRFARVAP